MARFLHQLSGFCFYLLGSSFFAAALFLRSNIAAPWPGWWLQAADLPLAAAAIVYGGTSLSLSVSPPEGPPRLHPAIIAFPLVILFALLITLNFWTLLPLAQAQR